MREILASLDEARERVSECEDINYSQLISWLVGLAGTRKIIRLKSAQ